MRSLLLVLLLALLTAIRPGARGQTFETLYADNVGRNPGSTLVNGSDGNFYGTTESGGASNYGTIFKITPAGELTTLASFNGTNGLMPRAGLVEGNDGSFYGTTYYGGVSGYGTIFKVTSSGELTTLASFDWTNGSYPSAELVKGRDGNFYGMTESGGVSGYGTIFKVTPTGELNILVSFGGTNGSSPIAQLMDGGDGNFYGLAFRGGDNYGGTIIRVTPAGELTTLVSSDNANFRGPHIGLVKGSDGNFYGVTDQGGASQYGMVFKVTPTGELTTLVSFNYTNGGFPCVDLVEGSDGSFYGMTSEGGPSGWGTIFRVTPAGAFTTMHSFLRYGATGSDPRAGLVKGSDGNLYGTTSKGGLGNYGIVFKITPAGAFTTLASFNSPNGSYYEGLVETSNGGFDSTPTDEELVQGSDGSFYGTASGGGASGAGTIFKVTPAGVFTTLVSFNGTNGSSPRAGLVEGSDGNFYGTTEFGGARVNGVVFKMTPAGELTTLVSFNYTNGTYPRGRLVEGSDGNFYGTTEGGGASQQGVVFKMTPAGELTSLVSFNGTTGSSPRAGLKKGKDGNFYGTTSEGGASGFGTIFKMTPAGGLTKIHSFDGVLTAYPSCAPVFGSDGKLYGTASQMAIWRLWLVSVPAINTTSLGSITATGATLSGSVDANGANTTVTFEYGLTPSYGNSVTATPATVTGRSETTVNGTLTGLSPHTTYYYRITASNSEGTTSTTGGSFVTANSHPVAVNDSFIPAPNYFGPISLAVLGNDSDADGDQLTITFITQGSLGTVSTDGATITYTPRRGFLGRDTFSYTISDGIDSVTAQVKLRAVAPFASALLSKDSEVPGADQTGSGIPAGALFKSFGVPSINSIGRLAFTASYGAPKKPSELSVIALDPKAVTSTLAARKGQIAPGTNGALFSSFKDPLLNGAGDVAFLATISGGDVTKQNKEGLWIYPSSVTSGAGTRLMARSGAQPPGAPAGARWKSFTSVALSASGTDTTSNGNGWSLAFTAFMSPGAGGVNTANDMGLWIARPSKTVLALRESQKLQIAGAEKKLRSFAGLMALPNALGQGNGLTSTGGVSMQAFFTDGSQAVLRVSGDIDGNIVTEALALPGDAVATLSETAAKFGIPAQSGSGAATAWLGSLSGKGSPAAIFERNLSEPELLQLLARKGEAASGIEGGTFSAFRSVAVNDSGSALFLGKVIGKGISSSNDEGLWWKQGSGDNASLQLLAREGAQPPGVPEGARWSSFTSLALAEGPYGPLFTAKLVAGAKGKGPGKITSANDQGLWAVNSKGELQLIVQEGQEVIVAGSTAPKTLKSFTLLSAVPGSPTQRRSFAGDGQIVYRALFTDGSQAVVKVQLP